MRTLTLAVTSVVAALATVSPAAPFEFEDGDRIVLLGNTFFEREGGYGHLEARLAVGLAGKKVTVRNMGWSGDTVDCHARSYFGPPQEGFDRLKANLERVAPTVVLACYGGNAAFSGEAGLAEFEKGYERLLDMVAGLGARICLISPPPCETLGAPLPDMAAQNARLAVYRDAIAKLAEREGYGFVDLFGALTEQVAAAGALTDNGVHFTEAGYAAIAPAFAAGFGIPPAPSLSEDFERLRGLVVEKNRLFFNGWRPQNETYLRGFRKHEQGQNAAEIAEFTPLVEAQDAAIHALASELAAR